MYTLQGRCFFFSSAARKKKIQASEAHVHDYSTPKKEDFTWVTFYLIFSPQPSCCPWIISMLFLNLSYTMANKQSSAGWMLKWKQHSVISPLIYYSIFTNYVLHKLSAIKSENMPVAVLYWGTCIWIGSSMGRVWRCVTTSLRTTN